jgi:hypothetical protein
MIEATWVGGPNDGSVMALPSEDPFFLVMAPAFAYVEYEEPDDDATIVLPVMKARVTPHLTERGWRLYYSEMVAMSECDCDCHEDVEHEGED